MSTYNTDDKKLPGPVSPTVPLVPTPPPSGPTATLGQKTVQDKIEEQHNPIQYYIKASFMITYILLLTTATITFIEAMRTQVPGIRHVLNLETCISIVAGYFYSVFLSQIDGFSKENKPMDWSEITKTRYIDWSITTPMMLLTLCIVLGMEHKKKVGLYAILAILAFNYIMLYTGYLGETKVIDRTAGLAVGFAAFFAMFYIIWANFVKGNSNFSGNFLYMFYLLVWGLYGIVYMLEDGVKNIAMNILDCIAKCLIGLGLWVYYSHAVGLNGGILPST
jgi:hypothetical protein